jgi:hypothetical protein
MGGRTTAPQHFVSSKVELRIDFDVLTQAQKTALEKNITNATVANMEPDDDKRAQLMQSATTVLAKKAVVRRLKVATDKADAVTVATTKVIMASAAEAASAESKIKNAASAMKGEMLAAVKSIPDIGNAVPGGVDALTVSAAIVVTTTSSSVTPASNATVAPTTNSTSSDAYDVRNYCGWILTLLVGASSVQAHQ